MYPNIYREKRNSVACRSEACHFNLAELEQMLRLKPAPLDEMCFLDREVVCVAGVQDDRETWGCTVQGDESARADADP